MKDYLNRAEVLARKFRIDNGLSQTEPISMKAIVRKLNILTVYRPLSSEAAGLSLSTSAGDRFILVNSNSPRGRQHFTIAHELYHLFYDEAPRPHLCRTDGKSKEERQADMFASALLMPFEGVLAMLPAQSVAEKEVTLPQILRLEQYFGVSRSTMLLRLKELNLLTEGRYEEFSKLSPTRTAYEYGYDNALYRPGNEGLVIGDYGEKARALFEMERISEGHYNELLKLLRYDQSGDCD